MEPVVLTHQDAFNLVVRGMRDQGWKKACAGGDWVGGLCRYRTGGGLKCAIGHLIPDDRYSPKMEGMAVNIALTMAGVQVTGLGFHLQDCHDGALDRLSMHQNLQHYAIRYGLEFPADCISPLVEEEGGAQRL